MYVPEAPIKYLCYFNWQVNSYHPWQYMLRKVLQCSLPANACLRMFNQRISF